MVPRFRNTDQAGAWHKRRMKPSTRAAHAARIARVLDRLAAAPDRAPTLEEMAGLAALSPFHFHRAYLALCGETPADTLARARMARAAGALRRRAVPVAAVARDAGYGSAAAFTRAFRAAHGIPPAAWRDRLSLLEEIPMNVEIVTLPPLRLAGWPHQGPYDAIGVVFDRLAAWAAGAGLPEEVRWFGLYLDDPHTVPPAALRSFAMVALPPGHEGAPGMERRDLPALRCARLRHQGPYAELEPLYDRIYGEWLPASGEEPADQPMMEEYLNDCRRLPPAAWLTDILMPLR